jgi:hypothetical protein
MVDQRRGPLDGAALGLAPFSHDGVRPSPIIVTGDLLSQFKWLGGVFLLLSTFSPFTSFFFLSLSSNQMTSVDCQDCLPHHQNPTADSPEPYGDLPGTKQSGSRLQ